MDDGNLLTIGALAEVAWFAAALHARIGKEDQPSDRR